MNNILTFEDYRKMNIRQIESVIYRQFIEEKINNEVNEGIIRKAINKAAGNFIQNALADEIEKGKELEKSIKEALDGLDKGFEEIKKKIENDAEDDDSKTELSAIEKVKEAIKAVQSQAFDTLTMIGSEGEIDFAGFMGSATVAAAVNFGILFSPIRSIFMTRKAYKYFLGIIKQTIRRNLLIIQLNFDQFENLILQKSFETEEDSETSTMSETLNTIIGAMQSELCGKDSKLKFTGKKGEEMRKYLANFKETQNAWIRQRKEDTRRNPLSSLWQDQHNNTYTRTLEQIKQYINDDSQKELDALKNSISKMAGNDVELVQYGELLMAAAEEYAVHTNHGINNNFIKMSSVFNLENQKNLIELIKKSQEENEAEVKKKKVDLDFEEKRKEREENIEEGKKLYEEKLKDKDYTFDEFNDTFSESEQGCLRVFFQTDEGKDVYNELIEKNPMYKYFIFSDIEMGNTFFSSINDLKIVKVSDMVDFYDSIVKQDQTLYYMMAERSIKNAFEQKTSEDYFGFDIDETDIDEKNKNILNDEVFEEKKDEKGNVIPSKISKILNNIIKNVKVPKGKKTSFEPKTKYFLTFTGTGDNLFNILHNNFTTKIFKDNGKYENNISTENKEIIAKLINRELKIGNDISTQLAEYLIRLEAHMMLKNQKSWFVAKNDKILLKCFDRDAKDEAINRTAFVEIRQEDFKNIDDFLTKYHALSKNDFKLPSEKDDKKEEK